MNMKMNVYQILHEMNRFAKVSVTVFTLFSLMMLSACGSDSVLDENIEEEDGGTSNVVMDMKSVRTDIMNNSLLYVFNNDNKFIEKKLNVKKETDKLVISDMPVNTASNPKWNFVMLSCLTDIESKITKPNYLQPMDNKALMWTTGLTTDGKYMEQTPDELRYASIPNVVIVKDQRTDAAATLSRNVAKIQVILKNYDGFSAITGTSNVHAYAELHNVPNALAWDGTLYSADGNINNPQLSAKPIREYLKFNAGVAETVEFIVPASRGALTDKKITLRMSMPLVQNGVENDYYKEYTILFIPKANGVIEITVKKFSGEPETELNVNVSVKKWEDEKDQNETFD